MQKAKKICICLVNNYPHFSKTFTISLLEMQHYFYEWERKARREDLLSTIVQGGYQLDWMRNEVSKVALNAGQDIILYLDIDQTFPAETIPRMLMVLEQNEKHGYMAVSGLTTHKKPPYMPLIYNTFDEKTTSFAGIGGGFPMSKPFPIAAASVGCLMIDIRILKEKPAPWFKFAKPNEVEGIPKGLGEDLYFCWYLKPKMLCDPTIVCGHFSEFPATIEDYVNYNELKVKDNVIQISQKRLNEIKDKHEMEKTNKSIEEAEKLCQ